MEIDNYSVMRAASSRRGVIEYLEKNVDIFHQQSSSHIASLASLGAGHQPCQIESCVSVCARVCVCKHALLGFGKAEN